MKVVRAAARQFSRRSENRAAPLELTRSQVLAIGASAIRRSDR
jgi:hypothetical protein